VAAEQCNVLPAGDGGREGKKQARIPGVQSRCEKLFVRPVQQIRRPTLLLAELETYFSCER
jgi:hypothetical protein